ncbi:MAG: FAD-dependent oxidoreductase [Spirochaetales bacterium]|nr:FAD-dependent oxidoreductase [Spirochaetales bacterium]
MAFEIPRVDPLPFRVAVIGGGGTGAALAWDLALRGFRVVIFERGEFLSGTTGRHHGQLHSGARYASGDPEIARECMAETLALRRLVPDAIEYNGGLFVALDGEEAAYGGRFAEACAEAGIPAREVSPARARELEPGLSSRVERAFLVPDGTFDAWRVPAAFLAGARELGAELRPWTGVVGFDATDGRVTAARVRDRARAAAENRIEADCFVIACGAWGGTVGALAGLEVPVTPAAGSMLAVKGRLCDMVISRLRPPGDGDILVPQRGLSIIGSTQRLVESPDALLPTDEEIAFLRQSGAALAPAFADAEIDSAWCAARPLFGSALDEAAGRAASRDFAVLDHETDGMAGIASVVGGKATTLRVMAEKAADLVCRKLGVERSCRTLETAPPSWRDLYRGRAP